MGVINELCGTEGIKPKNTGNTGVECIEGILVRQFYARAGFSFPTLAAFKDREEWIEAIQNKDIVPMFTAWAVANANTEATNYTTGGFSYQTDPGAKITTYENYLGLCSHAALASYNGSEYTQVFELNSDGSFIGVMTASGAVKGQDAKVNVGIRQRTVLDKPATTLVTTNYVDYKQAEQNGVIIKTSFGSDLQGIFDVILTQISATSTSIKFKAVVDCGGRALTTLTAADVVVRNASGVVQTVTFVPADADGVYTITGTAFASGFTVEIDGVILIGEVLYEGEDVLTIVV